MLLKNQNSLYIYISHMPAIFDILSLLLENPTQIPVVYVQWFTLWSLTLVLLHKYLYTSVNLLFISSIVLVCGLAITYIYPRYIKVSVGDQTETIEGTELKIIDFLFHWLPFLFILWTYGDYYANYTNIKNSTIVVLLIVLVYLLFNNLETRYFMTLKEIWSCILVIIIINVIWISIN
jgi:hypothetical protein